MLDLRKIGAYISKLRKDQDITQLEVADQLNVSHQAVSKWERGESLPDIGTLPQIAKLFDKTVDDCLSPDLLASLAPFLDQGTLSSMVTNLIRKEK